MDKSTASSSEYSRNGAYETEDEYKLLAEISISSLTELGKVESSIIVPKQRAYINRWVISSSLADTSCATLDVRGLLNWFNITLRTSYTLENPSLLFLLEDCIANNHDFGGVYSHLRPVWYTDDWHTVKDKLFSRGKEDKEARQRALVGNRIVRTNVPVRRIWDLYSNRVVSSWVTYRSPLPISHAWMDEKDRVEVWTPINGYEWPVPIPKDANLDLIRIEMLNLGAEYVWLDVLCLRQKGGPRKHLRAEEWKLDVPTIGNVYHDNTVVCYLNGLGRPLNLTAGYLESDRCWFRRAWTLQEIGVRRIIVGDTPDGPLHTELIEEGSSHQEEILTRFHTQLRSLENIAMRSFAIFGVLADM
ncbi:uncharacterized protein EV420DRAFT_594194 [Desarmillaria tabescens]|uniref:Heterokaryon incompatibility domain-containing protein n=1 Tax=Armillaria tabescens TaxID=1929756 RepID=A0AA39K669_ARMTA|nr:uncharacterized protein EV420DRAFT_594194 [Desarmillaria tabescens]KAK0455302.1 hypothetical protein EV420DRAFT_594194 [Desarmillaria tabescens]